LSQDAHQWSFFLNYINLSYLNALTELRPNPGLIYALSVKPGPFVE